MPRDIKANISRNECNKVNIYREIFGYKISNNSREALILDKKIWNTLWSDNIANEIMALQRLGVFQLYPPKTKFQNKDGWKYAPMHMILYVKHQDLRHKTRLVLSGNVVDFTQHCIFIHHQRCVCDTSYIDGCEE